VALLSKIDWKAVFEEMARESRARAGRVADPSLKVSWTSVAIRWERLARLQPDNCFCGRPAIGAKIGEDGAKIPYCGAHLAEAIDKSIRARYDAKYSG
jgi:hypothetical protein